MESGTIFSLRELRVGDIGWIIHRQGLLYHEEYGWNEQFEALVAEIASKFILNFDPEHENCWIAEQNSAIIGSVFLVKDSAETAKLRLLYVEPKARGLGIGKALIKAVVDFSRQVGYKTITLWTNDVLHAARHIYEETGFRLIREEAHHSFGNDLLGQFWELELR